MNKLDLHGVPHIDVENEVKRFIEDNWSSGEPVEIVTGHSPRMLEFVMSVVGAYNVPFGDISFHPTYIVVRL